MIQRTLLLAAVCALPGLACVDADPPPPGELRIDRADADGVAGAFVLPDREIAFSSTRTAARTFAVRFELPGGELGTDVDWDTLVAEPRTHLGWAMSLEDRADLDALARAVDHGLDRAEPAADNLVRQAALWARHPAGELVLDTIVADRARGWTTLCNGTSYRTFTWTWGSTTKSEYLKYGPGETSNPCRARCGAGCTAAWGTSAWTVDCGRHDRCEQYGGSGVNSQCNDEFASASDDFTFAGNCDY